MKRLTLVLACVFVLSLSGGLLAQWGSGWSIPAGAEKEMSPLKPTPDVLKQGRAIFERSCQKCHGADGTGGGPDDDPRNPAADLTDEFRIDLNPDGVMYHRVFSGKPPIMPAFKSQLSPNEIWAVVEYAKSLRKKS